MSTGLQKVAQFRAGQLQANGYLKPHDPDEIREAFNTCEYGEYVTVESYYENFHAIMDEWGVDDKTRAELLAQLDFAEEDEGWYASGTEASGNPSRGDGETPDELGLAIATLFRNSSKHWAYLQSADYAFAGVGLNNGGYGLMVSIQVSPDDYTNK